MIKYKITDVNDDSDTFIIQTDKPLPQEIWDAILEVGWEIKVIFEK